MVDRRTGAKPSGAKSSILLADISHAMTLVQRDHQVFAPHNYFTPLPIAYPRFASQRQSTLVPRYSCCTREIAREGCPINNSLQFDVQHGCRPTVGITAACDAHVRVDTKAVPHADSARHAHWSMAALPCLYATDFAKTCSSESPGQERLKVHGDHR